VAHAEVEAFSRLRVPADTGWGASGCSKVRAPFPVQRPLVRYRQVRWGTLVSGIRGYGRGMVGQGFGEVREVPTCLRLSGGEKPGAQEPSSASSSRVGRIGGYRRCCGLGISGVLVVSRNMASGWCGSLKCDDGMLRTKRKTTRIYEGLYVAMMGRHSMDGCCCYSKKRINLKRNNRDGSHCGGAGKVVGNLTTGSTSSWDVESPHYRCSLIQTLSSLWSDTTIGYGMVGIGPARGWILGTAMVHIVRDVVRWSDSFDRVRASARVLYWETRSAPDIGRALGMEHMSARQRWLLSRHPSGFGLRSCCVLCSPWCS